MSSEPDGSVIERGVESVEALAGRYVPETVGATEWSREEALLAKRAPLRIYLGAAPGVGKTYAMLSEGRRRLDRGTDVVVAWCETYGRPQTIAMLEALEQLPPATIVYRERDFSEMDAAALIARRPQVALIDELAHTNIPGSHRAKRWEDVIDVLAEGIEVITTLNVRALLRRIEGPSATANPRYRVGDVEIDLEQRRVTRGGEDVRLTRTEWSLLEALARNHGKLLTHRWLLVQVWGDGYDEDVDVLRVCVSQLRKKVEPDPRRPQAIATEPGVGYRWTLRPEAQRSSSD